ncbi:putative C2 domain-containing protein [Neospora caninum Liverpool]|uniref:C2 domain-containing protein, putative n=1 Tax=Neospora caninum (strain Liverpool) TaxID=572307 RepID=F0VDZ1_NEOCL|nr:putative C2 domain-containing protein [Neospora caninum Liverpool]CBZ51934.1 putative C2 domain-containing protein [Neospora caninum Liverpool]CEL65896.1 TPA: C2 domain-containing protein, putative [Neospora caninum Liverpool]|eukprot:XP_003881967.1 putative C2 domain-containing protein [Neospora caninum Liverpool]
MSDVSGTPAVPAAFIASAVAEKDEDKESSASARYQIHTSQGSVLGVPQTDCDSPVPDANGAAQPATGLSLSGTDGSGAADPRSFAAVTRERTIGVAADVPGLVSSSGCAEVVKIKVVIYGGQNMDGKKLYCKFYHGSCKHKTSTAVARRNPEWKEWFSITHLVSKQSPVLRIEIWGGGFLGKEVKGFCDVDLSPVLHDHVLVDGLYDVRGCGGQLRVKLINMDLLPRWERTIAAEAALHAIGEEDPEGVLALMIDDLKRIFPAVPYKEIALTLRAHDWRRTFATNELRITGGKRAQTIANLRKQRPIAVGDPGQGCVSLGLGSSGENAKHESFMERKKRQQIREVAKMLPDVDLEEIEHTLRTNNWNVCAAVDELILAHRETDMPTQQKGDGVRITKLDTTAQAGGFVAVEQHHGLEVRHSSALPPQRSGVGDKKFRQRVMMFEREKEI